MFREFEVEFMADVYFTYAGSLVYRSIQAFVWNTQILLEDAKE